MLISSIKELEEALEIVFENLDTIGWEDSYHDMGGYGEPNEMVKETPADKKQYLYEIISGAIEELNMRRCKDR